MSRVYWHKYKMEFFFDEEKVGVQTTNGFQDVKITQGFRYLVDTNKLWDMIDIDSLDCKGLIGLKTRWEYINSKWELAEVYYPNMVTKPEKKRQELTIRDLKWVGKWVEFYFEEVIKVENLEDNVFTETWYLSCKSDKLWSLVDRNYVYLHGMKGLITIWEFDSPNWELKAVEFPF